MVRIAPEVSQVAPGSMVTVNVRIENVANLHTALIGVSFDKSIVQFSGCSAGTFLQSNEQGYSVFYYERMDPLDDPDSVRIDQAILGNAAVDGSGDVCSFTFRAIREGTSPITISTIELRKSPNYVIDATPLHGTVIVGQNSNRSPEITSVPPLRCIVREPYSYQLHASDPDADPLEYRISEGPAFLGIDASTGLVSGTPASTGKYPVRLRVIDGKGGTAVQEFAISVFHTDHPPSQPVQVSPSDASVLGALTGTLQWTESIDPNTGDAVTYSVRLRSGSLDTTFTNLTAASLRLDESILKTSRLYSWTVEATDGADTVRTERAFTFRTPSPTPVERVGPALADGMIVEQNYPNPFAGPTTIGFSLRQHGHVTVAVYDVAGRRVAVLMDAECTVGRHTVRWSGQAEDGSPIGPGCYFAILSTATASRIVTMVLQR